MSPMEVPSSIPGQQKLLLEDIIYEKEWRKYVARITINRPDVYNAYTFRTLREICEALEDAMWDDGIQLIVITGAGDKAFCTGGDVKEYAEWWSKRPQDFFKYGDTYGRMLHLIRHCGKPVIARLNGIVAGGGNEIHAACDLSIAADHVEILQPGPRVGMVSVGGATQWLPLIIGDRRARWLVYSCERIDARQAKEWGLVNEVVPREMLDEAVENMCKLLLEKMPTGLRYAKTHLEFWKDFVWELTWHHARDWFAYHVGSYETLEGLKAFAQKRKARYGEMREMMAGSGLVYAPWGPRTKKCKVCGAEDIPERFAYCGLCGSKLG